MKYTEEHAWLRVEEDLVVVGLTEYAVEALGDLVFIELPEEGRMVVKDEEVAVIESASEASDLMAPVDGEIVEVNEALIATPTLVNEDALGDGWFFKMALEDMSVLDDMMDESVYLKFIG